MKKNRETESAQDEPDILARLSERVDRAVTMIADLRRERDALKAKLAEAESKLQEQESIEEDFDRYRKERGEIRSRIESILGSLETLDEA